MVESLEHRNEAATGALFALLAPLLAMIPISLIGVWWIVRRSMRPVDELKHQIETRGGGDLSPVSAEELPIEISPIAKAVNLLMDRLRNVLDAERSFSANSAHELRTPIAAALAQTQRLMSETTDEALITRARQIETSLHHLTNLSSRLMHLAKAEGGSLLAQTPQDSSIALTHIIDGFSRTEEGEGRLKLNNPGNKSLVSNMDPDAFAILMNNLVENALKYSRPDSLIEIEVGPDGAVKVRNEGNAVPEAVMSRLKTRFVRGQTDVTGSGLGLAIADTIARGANANLCLRSPASGHSGGFEAILTL